jgi:hypothetical protein
MDLAGQKGFTVAPLGYQDFTAYLAEEDEKVKAIFKEAGLYQSK